MIVVEKENEIYLVRKSLKDKELEILTVRNKLDIEVEL